MRDFACMFIFYMCALVCECVCAHTYNWRTCPLCMVITHVHTHTRTHTGIPCAHLKPVTEACSAAHACLCTWLSLQSKRRACSAFTQ